MAKYWYSYTGSSTPTTDFYLKSKYIYTSGPAAAACQLDVVRPCAIYVTGPGTLGSNPAADPTTTSTIGKYITRSTSGGSTYYPLSGQAFVYAKN